MKSRVTLTSEPLEKRQLLASGPFSIPLPAGHWDHSPFQGSPIFADVNGDGLDELITTVAGGRLIAYSMGPDRVPEAYVAYDAPTNASFRATPVVVDLPDGRKGVFASLGRDETNPGTAETGQMFGWYADTGQVIPGWPVTLQRNMAGQGGSYNAVASGDVDGDGFAEIVVTSFSHFVEVFRTDGSLVWRYNADDTIVSAAAIGDIDRDGRAEVVFGSDTSDNPFFTAGGFINILDNSGSAKFRYKVGEVVWSAPVLADINNDGFLEVIVGTGLNFDDFDPRPGARDAGNRVYAIDYKGQPVAGWPYATTLDNSQKRQVIGNPAVADINGDGFLEVVVADRGGFLHVIGHNGSAIPGWAGGRQIAWLSPPQDGYSSPVVADLNGDDNLDIIAFNGPSISAFNSSGQAIMRAAANSNGRPAYDSLFNAAAVGNWSGAGAELAIVSHVSAVPNYPAQILYWHLSTPVDANAWPSLRGGSSNRGVRHSEGAVRDAAASMHFALTGEEATPEFLSSAVNQVVVGATDLFSLAHELSSSYTARVSAVDQMYAQLLDRPVDPVGRYYWSEYLKTGAIQDLAILITSSEEYRGLGGNTVEGIVTRMYETILGRDPEPGAIATWVKWADENGLDSVASKFWLSDENLDSYYDHYYSAAFGFGGPKSLDSKLAFRHDIRTKSKLELEAYADLVASGGNYAATNDLSAWIRTLYRDLLHREASSVEVASWLSAVAFNQIEESDIPAIIIGAAETRDVVVAQTVQRFLRRQASAEDLRVYRNFVSREELLVTIIAGVEYSQRQGSDVKTFVRAAYHDVYQTTNIPQSWIDSVSRDIVRNRLSKDEFIRQLLFGDIYFNLEVVNALFQYIPDESAGVLRTSNRPPSANPVAVNPDPGLVNYFIEQKRAGLSQQDLIVTLVSTPAYKAKSSYYRGYFRGVGVRD